MKKTETEFIFTMSEAEARSKIREWYKDKKNLTILSCFPGQRDDKGYEVRFSYDEPGDLEKKSAQSFSIIWDTEVKKLAQACVKEPKWVSLMMQDEDYKLTAEENEYVESMSKKYKDPAGMFYISELIWKVEHALADGRDCQAQIPILNVYSSLNSPDYLTKVFKGDNTGEEWKSMMALKEGLKKLINC